MLKKFVEEPFMFESAEARSLVGPEERLLEVLDAETEEEESVAERWGWVVCKCCEVDGQDFGEEELVLGDSRE